MLLNLWGEILDGRLSRLQFLVSYLLIAAIAILLAFGLGAVIGAAERMGASESLTNQVSLADSLGPVGLTIVAAMFALLLLGQLNIMAKRLRDMGAPAPWLIVLAWMLLAGFLSSGGGVALGGLLGLGFLLALLFVPTGAFGSGGAGASTRL